MSHYRTEDAGNPGTDSTRDAWRTDAVEEARLRFLKASQSAWKTPLRSDADRRSDFLAVAAGANNQGHPDIRLPGPDPMAQVSANRGPFPPSSSADLTAEERAAEEAKAAFMKASRDAWKRPLSSNLDR